MKNLLQSLFLLYLRQLAKLQLRKTHPRIVGVTGSAGKTSAVKALALALETKYQVKYTKKGNSETGIPLEILGINVDNFSLLGWLKITGLSMWKLITYWPSYDILVAEMGIDSPHEPKNMAYLLKILQPQIGVFLSVTSVHAQYFEGKNVVQSIANEKAKLLKSLPADGLAVYSLDYPEITKAVQPITVPEKTFSDTHVAADMVLQTHTVDLKKTVFTFRYQGRTYTLRFEGMCLFKESFGTFASALLIADHLGIPLEDAITALETQYQLAPGRMSLFNGIERTTIIDSSYNSSLAPTSSALRLLHSLPSKGKKIAVIGDMRELGKTAQSDHERLAEVLAHTADVVFLVGSLTRHYTLPHLLKIGFPESKVKSFVTAYDALPTIKALLRPQDIVLVKGSQNTIFLEIIVKALLADPNDARLLCRQTPYWEKQRQKLRA